MKFTDKEAINCLKKARSPRLEELIEEIDKSEEYENETDLRILYFETMYLCELFMEEDTLSRNEYLKAKKIMRETENGKCMPLDPATFKARYSTQQVSDAKELVNEVRRLRRLSDALCIKVYCDCEDIDDEG